MTSTTLTVNESLVKFDTLLQGIEYLHEEISTRKNQIMEEVSPEKVREMTVESMNSQEFGQLLVDKIRQNFGDDLYREVAFIVMGQIDNDIESFINDRVNDALRNAGVTVPETTTPAA